MSQWHSIWTLFINVHSPSLTENWESPHFWKFFHFYIPSNIALEVIQPREVFILDIVTFTIGDVFLWLCVSFHRRKWLFHNSKKRNEPVAKRDFVLSGVLDWVKKSFPSGSLLERCNLHVFNLSHLVNDFHTKKEYGIKCGKCTLKIPNRWVKGSIDFFQKLLVIPSEKEILDFCNSCFLSWDWTNIFDNLPILANSFVGIVGIIQFRADRDYFGLSPFLFVLSLIFTIWITKTSLLFFLIATFQAVWSSSLISFLWLCKVFPCLELPAFGTLSSKRVGFCFDTRGSWDDCSFKWESLYYYSLVVAGIACFWSQVFLVEFPCRSDMIWSSCWHIWTIYWIKFPSPSPPPF